MSVTERIALGKQGDIQSIITPFRDALDKALFQTQRVPQWLKDIHSHMEQCCIALCTGIIQHCSESGAVEVHKPINAVAGCLSRHDIGDNHKNRVTIAWNLLHMAADIGWVAITKSPKATVVRIKLPFALAMHGKWWSLAGTACPPMYDKPVQHTVDSGGGYITPSLRKGIVRGDWSQVSQSPVALAAANNMQNTGYMINTKVLKVATKLFSSRIDPRVNGRDRQAWSHNALLDLANQVGRKVFYNPTYFEGSGRIFYSCDLLSPQSNDLTRGLLLMSAKQQLNHHGWYWLAVHVANCFSGIGGAKKLDKLPFKARVKWVRKNSKLLQVIANDPLANLTLWWGGIGKKAQTFQALAAAIAWDEATRTGYCQQPVMLDQTCSNYGHAAAMLRDPDLARLTNMKHDDEPQDFHAAVLINFKRLASEMYDKDVVNSLTRNDVKSASMISGYGATVKGLAINLMGRKKWDVHPHQVGKWVRAAQEGSLPARLSNDPSEHYKIAFAMAELLLKAVAETAPAAFTITKAMRQCMKAHRESSLNPRLHRADQHCHYGGDCRFEWYSPSGFKVSLLSNKIVEDMICSSKFFSGGSEEIKWKFFTEDTNWRKMSTMIAPRFTHGNDAATLHIAFANVKFGVIGVHDCVGCLPNHMTRMYRIFRWALETIYKADPLRVMCDAYKVELKQGTWDVSEIRNGYMLS